MLSKVYKKPVAFITGAGRGIGRGIAIELSKAGYDIAANALTADPKNKEKGLFEVKERCEAFDVKFLPLKADLTDLATHDKLIQDVIDIFGRIDLFVSNAGIAPKNRTDLLYVNEDSYDDVIDTNCKSAFFLSQKVAKQMILQKENGNETIKHKIVFITSVSSDMASIERGEYCISKAALSMVAQLFSVKLATYGINVYEVRPGIIMTDMTSAVQKKYDNLIDNSDLLLEKRWGTPADVGKAVKALTSGDFDYSTGTIIEVSGGMNIKRL